MITTAFKFYICACANIITILLLSSIDSLSAENMGFTENKGQIIDQNGGKRSDVLYVSESNGLTCHLRNNGISYQLHKVLAHNGMDSLGLNNLKINSIPNEILIYRVDINWIGESPNNTILHNGVVGGIKNYYTESCAEGVMNVRTYKNITYKNLYNNIDLHYYHQGNEMEYDFILFPGANPNNIEWQIEGASSIIIDDLGNLNIETPLGTIQEKSPIAIQGNSFIQISWKIDGTHIGFDLGEYDKTKKLIIDPVVRHWGTYLGGLVEDDCSDLTYDHGGVYAIGTTASSSMIATNGAFQTTKKGLVDAFIMKFDTSGAIIWGTYFGGGQRDLAFACHSDGSFIYVTGTTFSYSGFTTTGVHQQSFGGVRDAYLVKFNDQGQRIWSTYIGGVGIDDGFDCYAKNNAIYVVGATLSASAISTPGAFQLALSGAEDAFIMKFSDQGQRVWGSYYGGTHTDVFRSCILVGNSLFVAGYTDSESGIASSSSHQSNLLGKFDGMLAKFNDSGSRVWGTYFGGKEVDNVVACVSDGTNIYISGHTTSDSTIASVGSYRATRAGQYDGFLAKFNGSGALLWGTYFGGSDVETINSSFMEGGYVYIVGNTNSSNLISTAGAHQKNLNGLYDAFLVKFNYDGKLFFGTYYGGAEDDFGNACISIQSNIFLAGNTTNKHFNHWCSSI